jgi:L-histidine Nalpha-methyltransferase
MFFGNEQGGVMDTFFGSPETQICRRFREACSASGSTILRRPAGADPVYEFARCTASGLLSAPRRLDSRFLYDAVGSSLFEEITLQPEYYLTRTETAILAANAGRVRELTGPVRLVELGSVNSAKIEHLLRAWLGAQGKACYIPVDVSDSALSGTCENIKASYPAVQVIGVNCEYHEAFPLLPQLSPVLVLFLGSSIGNFAPGEMSRFLTALSSSLGPGDFFLLGVDLVKERRELEAAYNDAGGVTANFTKNLFARMNRELGTSIDLEAIEHIAHYDGDREQIETFAYFTKQQVLYLAPLERQLTIPQGEMVQIEISRKFRLETFLPYLEEFGLIAEQVFTDDNRRFALLLLRRQPRYLAGKRSFR